MDTIVGVLLCVSLCPCVLTITEEEEEDQEDDGMEEVAIPDTDPEKSTVTVTSWERVNNNVAIWSRSPKDITDDEYNNFYKAISKVGKVSFRPRDLGEAKGRKLTLVSISIRLLPQDISNPQSWIHFKAEGEMEFKSILFVPGEASPDLYDVYYSKYPLCIPSMLFLLCTWAHD